MVRTQKHGPVGPVGKMLYRPHHSVVFLTHLVGSWVADVFAESLREYEALDAQPVHMPDQDFHAGFRSIAGQRFKMAVHIPDSEAAIRFRSAYGVPGVRLNTGREKPCSKPFENCSPIKLHAIQNPMS
jgi:hypothetical protein